MRECTSKDCLKDLRHREIVRAKMPQDWRLVLQQALHYICTHLQIGRIHEQDPSQGRRCEAVRGIPDAVRRSWSSGCRGSWGAHWLPPPRPSLAALGPEQNPLWPASLEQQGLRTHLPGAPVQSGHGWNQRCGAKGAAIGAGTLGRVPSLTLWDYAAVAEDFTLAAGTRVRTGGC